MGGRGRMRFWQMVAHSSGMATVSALTSWGSARAGTSNSLRTIRPLSATITIPARFCCNRAASTDSREAILGWRQAPWLSPVGRKFAGAKIRIAMTSTHAATWQPPQIEARSPADRAPGGRGARSSPAALLAANEERSQHWCWQRCGRRRRRLMNGNNYRCLPRRATRGGRPVRPSPDRGAALGSFRLDRLAPPTRRKRAFWDPSAPTRRRSFAGSADGERWSALARSVRYARPWGTGGLKSPSLSLSGLCHSPSMTMFPMTK